MRTVSRRPRGMPPPAMLRYYPAPPKPPLRPFALVALVAFVFSLVLSATWTLLDLPNTMAAVGVRSLAILCLGLAFGVWHSRRWRQNHPWPSRDEAARQMMEGWMQANRERASWN